MKCIICNTPYFIFTTTIPYCFVSSYGSSSSTAEPAWGITVISVIISPSRNVIVLLCFPLKGWATSGNYRAWRYNILNIWTGSALCSYHQTCLPSTDLLMVSMFVHLLMVSMFVIRLFDICLVISKEKLSKLIFFF